MTDTPEDAVNDAERTVLGDKVQQDAEDNTDRKSVREELLGDMKRARDTRPKVIIYAGHLPSAMKAVQKYLAIEARKSSNASKGSTAPDQIFKQSGRLVRLNRNIVPEGQTQDKNFQEDNALQIIPITQNWLTNRLDKSIAFQGPPVGAPPKAPVDDEGKPVLGADGKPLPAPKPKPVPKHCPEVLCKRMLDDETGWLFPSLASTIEAPTLRPDGTILSEPGYDPLTGLFFDPGSTKFPKIDPNPTIEQGRAAMAELEKILTDFPFVDQDKEHEGVSRSVALSAMLTAVNRRIFPTAPAIGIDADNADAGKTCLAHVVSNLQTGRSAAVRPFSASEEERRKQLETAMLFSTPFILYDNVTEVITGDTMEAYLTSPTAEGRLLGSHTQISMSTRTMLVFTACQISVEGTTVRRVLVTRMVPSEPLSIRAPKFKFPNILKHVCDERPRLIKAVLTALRAFVLHGKPLPMTEKFPEWHAMIASALVFYGYPDPIRGGDKLQDVNPTVEAQREVIEAWVAENTIGSGYTARNLIDDVDVGGANYTRMVTSKVRQAICDALNLKHPRELTTIRAAHYIDGLCVAKLDTEYKVEEVPQAPGKRQTKKWRLVRVGDPTLVPDVEAEPYEEPIYPRTAAQDFAPEQIPDPCA